MMLEIMEYWVYLGIGKKVISYMLDCYNIDYNYMLIDLSKIIMVNSGKGMF